MKKLLFSIIAASAISIVPASAASYPRAASFTSNTAADSGQCTVEVVVPGEARVTVQRDSADLDRVSGRSPEWRRFECTSPMPKKPVEFRMETVSGRGTQELVHGAAHHRGKAIVYINDRGHGEDTY